ncbi:MAG: hypothetical protein A2266_09235 [Bacteroidetes bacterium RIFOXYA12_FULL_40_10]|nr:MAG: hypothetical protein US49_C0004G0025 [candidate division TM6 bacterium GW2011_GWF2_37_49]OFY91349.1 MAG: hypothetical protein A2266_09235 [Bacteroidetes bacterium RIFOXYA12_FULL_40_10]HBG62230.1 hypothetical protein [Candidatus Omnitrophota bacterium]
MNRTIFIIACVFTAILGGSYLLIKFNPQLQSKPWIKQIAEVYGLINMDETPENYNAVFCIFDPSGSGRVTYGVPIITVDYIKQIISAIENKGNGELWLTFVDRSALNNKVLHFTIPKTMKLLRTPIREAFQLKGEYDKKLADFKADSTRNAAKYESELHNYNEAKEKFLDECREMITKGYEQKKPYEDYSDVIGSLNAAIRSLRTIESDSTSFLSILLISDGVQDIPASDVKQELKEIPEHILLVTVNYSGSLESVVAGYSLEVDNLDRGLEKVIRVYESKNQ